MPLASKERFRRPESNRSRGLLLAPPVRLVSAAPQRAIGAEWLGRTASNWQIILRPVCGHSNRPGLPPRPIEFPPTDVVGAIPTRSCLQTLVASAPKCALRTSDDRSPQPMRPQSLPPIWSIGPLIRSEPLSLFACCSSTEARSAGSGPTHQPDPPGKAGAPRSRTQIQTSLTNPDTPPIRPHRFALRADARADPAFGLALAKAR